ALAHALARPSHAPDTRSLLLMHAHPVPVVLHVLLAAALIGELELVMNRPILLRLAADVSKIGVGIVAMERILHRLRQRAQARPLHLLLLALVPHLVPLLTPARARAQTQREHARHYRRRCH